MMLRDTCMIVFHLNIVLFNLFIILVIIHCSFIGHRA